MLQKLLVFIVGLALFPSAHGQNARIQIIHNSPDVLTDTIDVYLNGTIWFNDLAFRNATPFVNITAAIEAQIDIAPKNSIGVSESLFNFSFTPTLNEKYLLIADGLISETGYLPSIPFSLNLFAGARELSTDGAGTDILLHHGSTDLNSFDLVETNLLQINAFDDVNYGEFRGYESILTAAYTFAIEDPNNNYNIGDYETPLAELGLGNDAVTIITSGFLNTTNNQNGPSFGLFLVLAAGGPFIPLSQPKAMVQLIHNSADAAASEIDLYLNGQLILNDFAYRTASPFIEVPATNEILFEVAPSTSTGPQDAIIQFPLTLNDNEKYTLAINGIISESGYNPSPLLSLDSFAGSRFNATQSTNTDILFVHGTTDGPTIDITNYLTDETIIDGISYSQLEGYSELFTEDYIWRISTDNNNSDVALYSIPLNTLQLDSAAITVIASGFIDPSINNNGPEFGLWYTTASGGPLLPLEIFVVEPVFARAQIIHNSPGEMLQTIDIYINGIKQFDDFNFRNATSFFDVQVNEDLEIAIAPQTSLTVEDAFITISNNLVADETYVMILSGFISEAGYNPLPEIHFDVFSGAREAALNNNETDVLVYHGSTDSPSLDIDESTLPLLEIVNNISYGDFNPYLSLSTSDEYAFRIRNNDGEIVLAEYDLPLLSMSLEGSAITLFACGFLNQANNNNGPVLHVWIAMADGTTMPLPIHVGVESLLKTKGLSVFPNPASEKITLSGELNRTSPVYYHVLNAQGRLVESGSVQSSNTSNLLQLQLENYAAGVYVLEVNNGQLSEKLIFSVFK